MHMPTVVSRRIGMPAAAMIWAIALPTFAETPCLTNAEPRIVRGASLAPLFRPGDEVILLMDPEQCLPIARGEIVAYQNPSRLDPFLKIVKAIPGDRFGLRKEADGWRLIVNGEVVTNTEGLPYLFGAWRAQRLSAEAEKDAGVIPPESYLLLGNLVGGSIARSRFGLGARARIIGRLASGPPRAPNRAP